MSKGNMLLGHARGKVGSLVFSRANGQQITRARAEVVKNPQTDAQMVQRILLNTVAQAYSKMSPIVDHSFEGIPAGQKSMGYFMKRNLEQLRNTLSEAAGLAETPPFVSPIGSNLLAINTYVVSKGSLPVIDPREVTGIGIFSGVTTNTYQAVIDKFGLQRGDQLTAIMVEEDFKGRLVFKYARIILDPRNEDGTEAPLSTAFFTGSEVTKPNAKNENNGIVFGLEQSEITFKATDLCAGGALIVSRQKADGAWMRSNSSLIVSEDGYLNGWSVQAALDDFKSGNLEVINPKYLNNAGKGGAAAAPASTEVTINLVKSDGIASVSGGGTVSRGQQVTVTASLNAGATFIGWYTENNTSSTRLSQNLSYTFTATQNQTLYAIGDEPVGD